MPEPQVGDDEVLLRVRAASLHPDAWRMVAGRSVILRFGTGLIPRFLCLMLRARFNQNLGSGKRSAPTQHDAMKVLSELVAAGKITPVVDSTHPLSEIHQPLRHLIQDELWQPAGWGA